MSGASLVVQVRPVTAADRDDWLRMREALWPDSTAAEHERDVARFLSGDAAEPLAVLLAVTDGVAGRTGDALGFVELSIRPYAEGCSTDRVAYVEGWFVQPAARRRGVGGALVRAAEQWARAQGCRELASDTELDNERSRRAHVGLGFEEAGIIRCFCKQLD